MSWNARPGGQPAPAPQASGWGAAKPAPAPAPSGAKPLPTAPAKTPTPTPAPPAGWGAKPAAAPGSAPAPASSPASAGSWGARPGGVAPKPTASGEAARAAQVQGQQIQDKYSDLDNPNQTTQRILRKLELTQDVADATMAELNEQNEKVVHMQDDLAEMHDDLDTSSRKLAGTSSFWGVAWGRKKHDQRNLKARGEYEKDLAKEDYKEEQRRVTQREQQEAHDTHHAMAALAQAVDDPDLRKDLRAAKKEFKRGGGPQESEDKVVFSSGDFVFEERLDGTGEQIQAEKDLEAIEEHVLALKSKAWNMGKKVDESSKRLDNVQAEVDRADARTQKSIKKGDKIIGK